MTRQGRISMAFALLHKSLPGLLFLGLLLAVAPGLAYGSAREAGGAVAAVPGAKDGAQLVAAARAAVETQPDSAQAHTRLANLLLASGAFQEAMRHFDQALVIKPNAFEAKTGRGIVLVKMGKLQEAEQVLQGALLLNPNPVRVHYELGRLYQKLGDHDKSLVQFKEGIRKHEQGRL